MTTRDPTRSEPRFIVASGVQCITSVDDKVIANAATCQELSQRIDRIGLRRAGLVIELGEPITSDCVC